MFSMNLDIYWEFFFEWDHDKCKGYIKKMKILNFKIWRCRFEIFIAYQKTC